MRNYQSPDAGGRVPAFERVDLGQARARLRRFNVHTFHACTETFATTAESVPAYQLYLPAPLSTPRHRSRCRPPTGSWDSGRLVPTSGRLAVAGAACCRHNVGGRWDGCLLKVVGVRHRHVGARHTLHGRVQIVKRIRLHHLHIHMCENMYKLIYRQTDR